MKKIFALAAAAAVIFTGCDSLQDTLSEEMQAKLDAETGSASYSYKTWYYNGISGEDITGVEGQTLLIDFGRKVASSGVSGKIAVTYTDSSDNEVTKTFSTVNGYFTSDYTGYRLNMSNVTALFDGDNIPDSTATMTINLTGFVCAEGNQKGRALSAFEAKNISIKPFFANDSYSFSTMGFSEDTTFPIECNAELSVEEGTVVTGTDSSSNTYEFTVTGEGSTVYLVPSFTTAPSDGTEMTIPLAGIIPEGSGDAYSKEITASFTSHYVVVDGSKDDNWSSDTVSYVADDSSDGSAFTWEANSGDLTGLYVVNDDDYLYVAIEGSFATTWSDGLAVMISYDHSSDVAYTTGASTFALADTVAYGREALAHGKPDVYLYHKPQSDEFGVWVENSDSADDVTSTSLYSPSGETTSASFIEYAIPMTALANAGIESGKTIHVFAAYSAHWDDGIAAADVVPDDCATLNDNHNSLTVNFQNALEYTLD
ncbi:hypothetical protein [Treponema sp.]|uniref:hypothetical protein n=1 Tax=Treponema sp. TaxID=166 RepID=UPI0025EE4FF4|nr:hypothetical protein [Treponema sp.]MCR5219142.1 hypothetical protein [Treponema sp.]